MSTCLRIIIVVLAAAILPASAQDTKAWLESQGLEATDTKTFEDYEVVVAHVKGAKDAAAMQERVIAIHAGKPVWQSPRDTEPASRWTLHSIGRDLDGDGHPDVHFSSYSGGAHCCTTHHIYRLKPQWKKVATYASGNVGGADFLDIPGRKAPVMISADDATANVFAPYANSYFPMVVLEVSPKGHFQFARELMQTKLPGQPPPICAQPAATANPWLKERCNEYITMRRNARATEIKNRLAEIKAARSADKLKWEDYYANGVLAAVSAEMSRYTYTGHGAAAYNWLETLWPGNDAVKVKFVQTLRQTQAKSAFAEDLKGLAADYR